MNKILFALLFIAFAAYGQQKQIAIINTVDDGEPPVGHSELSHLTDRLREIAVKTLPGRNYAVMTQQSIVAFLGSQDDMVKKCRESEGCLAKLGREINADYICQARIGRFGGDLTIKAELYEVQKGNLVGTFTGSSKDIYGLPSVLDKEAADMFKKMPGVSGIKTPAVVGGISDLQSSVDYVPDYEKSYLAIINTEPQGAALSFDGLPNDRCSRTPCKVELAEGGVRISASLWQYETADTTVSVKQNNQNISIALKPNFGVLEIKPAYSGGVGRDRQWSLAINDAPYSLGKIRLSPGSYAVKLNHECYENISFTAGMHKGKREVFDMSGHVKLKKGGLVLKAERNGEPSSEPVFVDGIRVGETPFSGSVAVCSEIGIGSGREKVNVKLEHKQTVRYVHKIQSGGASVVSGNALTDSRDGKKYKVVKIGEQTWIAENLNYEASGSVCYGNNSGNCKEYGRLYNWNTAMKACPSGWHLPSKSEYRALDKAVGGANTAGRKLKAKRGWNGTDEFGFSALPGGRGSSDGSFDFVGTYGYWWSASEYEDNSSYAYNRDMGYNYEHTNWSSDVKTDLFSVRCLQGPPLYEPPGYSSDEREMYWQTSYNQEPPSYEPPQYKLPKKSFWVALALDIAGAGLFYYGYTRDKEMVNNYEHYVSLDESATKSEFGDARQKVEDAKTKRNISYVFGSVLLATGIGVHIWF